MISWPYIPSNIIIIIQVNQYAVLRNFILLTIVIFLKINGGSCN